MDGTVTRWLAGAEQLFGYSSDEIVGQSILRIVPEDRQEELWALTERVARGERAEPFETERVPKDGRLLQVSVRSSPVKSRRGKVVGVSSIDRDIAHLKETERQLREANSTVLLYVRHDAATARLSSVPSTWSSRWSWVGSGCWW